MLAAEGFAIVELVAWFKDLLYEFVIVELVAWSRDLLHNLTIKPGVCLQFERCSYQTEIAQ